MDKAAWEKLIQSNIDRTGYHITVVSAGITPRFAYTIGLNELFKCELIFAGGVYYMHDQLIQIFHQLFDHLKTNGGIPENKVPLGDLGEFSLLSADPSWSKKFLLGAFDRYKDADVPVYQIIPDAIHFTRDTPDMSKPWREGSEPVWQWMDKKWPYKVPETSTIITNFQALQGAPITELMRWEEDYWEMFAGEAPDIDRDDCRVVSLATILDLDPTLLPALDLKIEKGLMREDGDDEWRIWR